jgi:hypothetical protein
MFAPFRAQVGFHNCLPCFARGRLFSGANQGFLDFESKVTRRAFGLSRWRGGRFAYTSLIRRWSLEELTVVRYDDVNMDSDVSSISMSINNGLLAQLFSIQQLPTQGRFKSHS